MIGCLLEKAVTFDSVLAKVRDRENPKSEFLLSWCGYGTTKMSFAYTDKVRQSIARSLTQLQVMG